MKCELDCFNCKNRGFSQIIHFNVHRRKQLQSTFLRKKSQIVYGEYLRAIFYKSHPPCDSRVFRISSYFSQLKIKVIPEYGRNFSFIRHFVELLGGREITVVFSRNVISVHKLYFESLLSLLELLFRVHEPCYELNTVIKN